MIRSGKKQKSRGEQGGGQSRAGPSIERGDGMAGMATGASISTHTETAEQV